MNIDTTKKSNLFMFYFMIFLLLSGYILGFIIYSTDIELNLTQIQIASYCLSFLLPVLFYRISSKKRFKDSFPMKKLSPTNIVLIIFLTLAIMPVAMILSLITSFFTPNTISDMVSEMVFSSNVAANLLAIAIMPAFFEELVFRGIILKGYSGINLLKVALVNGLFFAIMHLSLDQALYAFLLGFVFVLFVHCTKSIYSAMLAHFVFNGTQLALMLLDTTSPDASAAEVPTTVLSLDIIITLAIWVAIIIVVFLAIFRIFAKHNNKSATNLFKEDYIGLGDEEILSDYDSNYEQLTLNMPTNRVLNSSFAKNIDEIHEDYSVPIIFQDKSKSTKTILNWPFFATIAFYIFVVFLAPLLTK